MAPRVLTAVAVTLFGLVLLSLGVLSAAAVGNVDEAHLHSHLPFNDAAGGEKRDGGVGSSHSQLMGGDCEVQVEPSSLNFEDVIVGHWTAEEITLWSPCQDVDSDVLEIWTESSSLHLDVRLDVVDAINKTIVTVLFVPHEVGMFKEQIALLTTTGFIHLEASASVVGNPYELNPVLLAGVVPHDTTVITPVTLYNPLSQSLEVLSVSTSHSEAFVSQVGSNGVVPLNVKGITLPAKTRAHIADIAFTPSAPGNITGALLIHVTDDVLSIVLELECVEPSISTSVSEISFGTFVAEGERQSVVVQVRGQGEKGLSPLFFSGSRVLLETSPGVLKQSENMERDGYLVHLSGMEEGRGIAYGDSADLEITVTALRTEMELRGVVELTFERRGEIKEHVPSLETVRFSFEGKTEFCSFEVVSPPGRVYTSPGSDLLKFHMGVLSLCEDVRDRIALDSDTFDNDLRVKAELVTDPLTMSQFILPTFKNSCQVSKDLTESNVVNFTIACSAGNVLALSPFLHSHLTAKIGSVEVSSPVELYRDKLWYYGLSAPDGLIPLRPQPLFMGSGATKEAEMKGGLLNGEEEDAESVDFGAVSIGSRMTRYVVVHNPTSSSIAIFSAVVEGRVSQLLCLKGNKIIEGNVDIDQLAGREWEAVVPIWDSIVSLAPGTSTVLLLELRFTEPETETGSLQIFAQNEAMKISFRAEGAVGEIYMNPVPLHFPPSFSGRVLQKSLYLRSTFEQNVRIISVASSDPRIIPILTNRTLYSQKRDEIGYIAFDPSQRDPLQVKEPAASAPRLSPPGSPLTPEDLREVEHRRLQWDLLQRGEGSTDIEAIVIFTTDVGYTVEVSVLASLTQPSLFTEDVLDFSYTLVGKLSNNGQMVPVHNPSDQRVHVQLLPLDAPQCLDREFAEAHKSKCSMVSQSSDEEVERERERENGKSDIEREIENGEFDIVQISCSQVTLQDPSYSPFHFSTEARRGAIVEPHATLALGPIFYRPCWVGPSEATVFVKNNLTILESLLLRGIGEAAKVSFYHITADDDEEEEKKGEGEASQAVEVQRFQQSQSCTFNVKSTDFAHCKEDSTWNFEEKVVVVNEAAIPLVISAIHIDGIPCDNHGFEITRGCGPFVLQAGEEETLHIRYTPDFSSSENHANLQLSSEGVELTLPLLVQIPDDAVEQCRPASALSLLSDVLFKLLLLLVVLGMILLALLGHQRKVLRDMELRGQLVDKEMWSFDAWIEYFTEVFAPTHPGFPPSSSEPDPGNSMEVGMEQGEEDTVHITGLSSREPKSPRDREESPLVHEKQVTKKHQRAKSPISKASKQEQDKKSKNKKANGGDGKTEKHNQFLDKVRAMEGSSEPADQKKLEVKQEVKQQEKQQEEEEEKATDEKSSVSEDVDEAAAEYPSVIILPLKDIPRNAESSDKNSKTLDAGEAMGQDSSPAAASTEKKGEIASVVSPRKHKGRKRKNSISKAIDAQAPPPPKESDAPQPAEQRLDEKESKKRGHNRQRSMSEGDERVLLRRFYPSQQSSNASEAVGAEDSSESPANVWSGASSDASTESTPSISPPVSEDQASSAASSENKITDSPMCVLKDLSEQHAVSILKGLPDGVNASAEPSRKQHGKSARSQKQMKGKKKSREGSKGHSPERGSKTVPPAIHRGAYSGGSLHNPNSTDSIRAVMQKGGNSRTQRERQSADGRGNGHKTHDQHARKTKSGTGREGKSRASGGNKQHSSGSSVGPQWGDVRQAHSRGRAGDNSFSRQGSGGAIRRTQTNEKRESNSLKGNVERFRTASGDSIPFPSYSAFHSLPAMHTVSGSPTRHSDIQSDESHHRYRGDDVSDSSRFPFAIPVGLIPRNRSFGSLDMAESSALTNGSSSSSSSSSSGHYSLFSEPFSMRPDHFRPPSFRNGDSDGDRHSGSSNDRDSDDRHSGNAPSYSLF